MKRYTGQKALYEAISRSKARSHRRSILERLYPVDNKVKVEKVEPPVAPTATLIEEPKPQVKAPEPQVEKPAKASKRRKGKARSAAEKPSVQTVEKSSAPAVEKPPAPMVEKPPAPAAEKSPEPTVEKLPEPVVETPPATTVNVPEPVAAPSPVVKAPVVVASPEPNVASPQPWLRPRPVQIHDGRIEISLPYTIGVTVVLVALLLVLAAYRLGQRSVAAPAAPPAPAAPTGQSAGDVTPSASPAVQDTPAAPAETVRPEAGPAADTAAPAAPVSTGDHIIVLVQYPQRRDLEPAQEYFNEHGVGTVIIEATRLGDWLTQNGLDASTLGNRGGWLLVTGDYYNNPQSSGTDGYAARQKIIELGRGYRAQPGYESFAPNYFKDAYGMKIR
ncbi:MAG: hypothetical protein JW741_11575 [Sedimentisphaerales bacterium]|nr:hypothetical protein [Sedimentisphaerales bacterium]